MTTAALQAWLAAHIAAQLGVDPNDVDVRAPFDSFGLSSREAVALSGELEQLIGRDLPATLIYEYPTIGALARYLGGADAQGAGDQAIATRADQDRSIAIIGMACRFPGAAGPAEFWDLLAEGRDMIREVPADRWDADAIFHPDAERPGRAVSRWGSFLDDIDRFDAFFFGISPGEAERMDPQQRMLLELAWECFDDAKLDTSTLAGSRTGVFVGISMNEYLFHQLGRPDAINGHSGTGNALSIAANRISYFFDLHGPSMAIDSACSSSLLAVHQACRSLRSGECALALAGGVNVVLSPAHAIAFTKAGVLARDGRCKTFDARADGYVRGEGGGLVALKRLSDALADGDRIYAVIRGSAVEQDGRTNGLMAPSREAQEAVLRAAYLDAGVVPSEVQYVEAHGTGTLLGDSIEAHALGAVVGAGRDNGGCAIGSVKSNFGHLEAAAGIAGLMKVALSLERGVIPATLHFQQPNPHIRFTDLGLTVQQARGPWPQAEKPLAGVSSFGFGGTNVHAVLEAAPRSAPGRCADDSVRERLIVISAHTAAALGAVARDWHAWLASGGAPAIDQLAAAAARRSPLDERAAIVAATMDDVVAALDAVAVNTTHPCLVRGRAQYASAAPVFVFSGQGGQWAGMGNGLLAEPVFASALEACDRALRPHAGWSLLEVLGAAAGHAQFDDIDVVQPVLFGLQVALAALWQSWGIVPAAVVGHSLGEVAAAHVAGALTLDDAARVIYERSRLLRRLSGKGAMAVVALSAQETREVLARYAPGVVVAASNSPASTVVAGEPDDVGAFCAAMERSAVWCRHVHVDVASHSPQTRPLASELRAALASIRPAAPTVRFISTVQGPSELHLDADYWANNLMNAVDFHAAIAQLVREGHHAFIEVGPHPVLSGSIQQTAAAAGEPIATFASTRRTEPERSAMLQSLASLFVGGHLRDVCPATTAAPARVTLPRYPWQRERYWMEGAAGPTSPPSMQSLEIADAEGARVWQLDLSIATAPYIADHRVNGDIVVPAATTIDLMLLTSEQAGLLTTHRLDGIELVSPIVLGERESVTVQQLLRPETDAEWTLTVHSRGHAGRWAIHASARLRPAPAATANRQQDSFMSDGTATMVEPDTIYAALARRGLDYGPAMRGLETIQQREGGVRARVVLPNVAGGVSSGHFVHPVLLDAALQSLAAAADSTQGTQHETFILAGCEWIQWYRKPEGALWSHARFRDVAPGSPELRADIDLLDDVGNIIASLGGLRLMRRMATPPPTMPSGIWPYEIYWRSVPWPAEAVPTSTERWLLLADRCGIAAALRDDLERSGHTCTLIEAPDSYDSAAVRAVLMAALDATAGCDSVVHMWSLDGASDAMLAAGEAERAERHCSSALQLVQVLLERSGTQGLPRTWLVTAGAQPVVANEVVLPSQAALWGLGRALGFELPGLKSALIDVDPHVDNAAAARVLLRALRANDDEELTAIRGEARFVARLGVPAGRRACASAGSTVRDDATYIITGGLGGLGLATARWLVDEGARYVCLIGRRPPGRMARLAIDQLRRLGATVESLEVDITDGAALSAACAEVRERMPPVRGVVHAAGVIDNAAVATLDEARLTAVMAPKVRGALNLHEATLHDQLDWFVMYSSAVSVLGSPGQGNYAAGNAFLDALAHARRCLGMRGTSINWGPWAEIGLVADGFKAAPNSGHGVKSISPEQGVAALAATLAGDAVQTTLLPFDLQSLLELYPQAAQNPFFTEVVGRDTHVARLYARPALPQPYVAPRTETERRLAELWRQTLRIDRVGVHDSFFELGGDSVLGAQVVTAAHRTFGVGIDLKEAFQAFTIAHLAERLDEVLADRADHIRRRSPEQPVPLSSVQERQLFLELLDPHTAVNNLCMSVRMDGQLDVERLTRSMNRLFARHAVLRTSFSTADGRPTARIADPFAIELNIVDCTSATAPLREALRLAEATAAEPFDLERAPMLRAVLYRLQAHAHLLLIVVHHTIADGWSLGIFLSELFTRYRELGAGETAEAAPLPLDYADFAAWQRETLRGDRIASDLAFWTQQLAGELPVIELPLDRPRTARQTFAGSTHRLQLPADMAERVRRCSREHDVTPFMTLLAAYAVMLHRFTGQDDLVIGTPTAGRTRPETEALIGAFISTLALRVGITGEATFAELLGRVRSVALGAYAHQELPFEKLVAELRPQRDLSRTPIFQVMFIMQNSPLDLPRDTGLALSLLPIDRGAAQFDLTLSITETAAGLDVAFEYNTDLFDAATIERMATAYALLLDTALAQPDAPIAAHPVMNAEDLRQLVVDFNETARDYACGTAVHELIAAQAQRTPHAVAVICDRNSISYAALMTKTDAWAAQLQALGVRRGDRVGVLAARSADLVTALISVLKAGAAYVPLDPETPAERLAFVIDDSGLEVLLYDDAEFDAAVQDRVRVQRFAAMPAGGRPQPVSLEPDDATYAIYTSGSTGQPKGVLIPHRAVVNLLLSMQERLELDAGDTLLAVTSVSFDIAALELFLPLITGAKVAVASRETTRNSRLLENALRDHQATIMQATPATWHLLLQGGWSGDDGLKVLCGGEALQPALAEQLLERSRCVWNLYGPTETTIWSSACRLERNAPITIGRPLANTQFFVLDEQRAPVPCGVLGELFIGGAGVALGYIGRPELNAERFVLHPLAGEGRKLFRTGDRARVRPDGLFELLGRFDHQVKLHGFRIELGEIEAALTRHPAVREACVVVRDGVGGGRSLAAYFVARTDDLPVSADLRAFLRELLPAYMVPTVFVALPELPLTQSGKVDRRALPRVGSDGGAAGFAPPRNDREWLLADTYAAVLALDRVGIHDNFFDLGGGSVQILEIIVRAQAEGLQLTPEHFFQYQTIAELGEALVAEAETQYA